MFVILSGMVENAVCYDAVEVHEGLVGVDDGLGDLSGRVDQADRHSLLGEVPGGRNDEFEEEIAAAEGGWPVRRPLR